MSRLVNRWQPGLISFATFVTRDQEAGREPVQEAWIAIMRGLAKLNDCASYRQ